MGLPPIEGVPDPDGADCVTCGRCCHHPPETAHVLASDEDRLGEALLREFTYEDPRPPGFRFLRNAGERCGALDVSEPGRFPCRIYERRPDDCRRFRPGSDDCLEARRLGRLGRVVG